MRKLSLSGFPEWLPSERLVELSVLDTLRKVFELHGFSSIETRAVETSKTLLRKGDIDKEVYAVSRFHEEKALEPDGRGQLALHFDLTVPFSRYVNDNAGYLDFPFRRYQIQKVWRGERPQDGRSREFTQADIDVVGDGKLPFIYDVELVLTMIEALSRLPIGGFKVRVNNRKLAEGYYRGLGIEDPAVVLRAVDRLEKLGASAVAAMLQEQAGLSSEQARCVMALAEIRSEGVGFASKVRELGVRHDLLTEGLEELESVMSLASRQAPGKIVADLSVARGLDYYTGTVYETCLTDAEELGSICSGGRYDTLANSGRKKYPGVGLSIGVTRMLSYLLGNNKAMASRKVPTVVYIALADESSWEKAQQVATKLRSRGIAAEVGADAVKFGKQIKHADRRGIPFVWFIGSEGEHQVKDIRSGEQVEVDPETWLPDERDYRPQIIVAGDPSER